jgi:hypothetical protein
LRLVEHLGWDAEHERHTKADANDNQRVMEMLYDFRLV